MARRPWMSNWIWCGRRGICKVNLHQNSPLRAEVRIRNPFGYEARTLTLGWQLYVINCFSYEFAEGRFFKSAANRQWETTQFKTLSNYGSRAVIAQSVSTGLRAGRSGLYGSNPGGGWELFSSPPRPERLWGPPRVLSSGYHGLFHWG
jgi:hypothetical protein